MSRVRKRLSDLGLSRVAEALEQAGRKSIQLKTTQASKEPVSRLGGRPNLPRGVDWPASEDGPLPFIAQIDLSGLPLVREIGLPRTGSLFFFYGSASLPSQAKEQELFRVLFSEIPLSESRLKRFPEDLPATSRWQGFKLAVGRMPTTFPWPEDTEVERLNLTDPELQAFGQFLTHTLKDEAPPLHCIGGYPNYIQHDPRFTAHLKSRDLWKTIWAKKAGMDAVTYFQETNRRFAEVRRELGSETSNWVLLLQVDSDERTGMMWGDAGRLYFLIRKEDLRAREFEKAWMIWDCY